MSEISKKSHHFDKSNASSRMQLKGNLFDDNRQSAKAHTGGININQIVIDDDSDANEKTKQKNQGKIPMRRPNFEINNRDGGAVANMLNEEPDEHENRRQGKKRSGNDYLYYPKNKKNKKREGDGKHSHRSKMSAAFGGHDDYSSERSQNQLIKPQSDYSNGLLSSKQKSNIHSGKKLINERDGVERSSESDLEMQDMKSKANKKSKKSNRVPSEHEKTESAGGAKKGWFFF